MKHRIANTENTDLNAVNVEGFWARRGGNVAGLGYVASNIAWMTFGATMTSPREFAAGAVNLNGGLSRMLASRATLFGITNFGTKIGALSGLAANVMSTWPGLVAGSPAALLSNSLIVVSQSMDLASEPLIQRFAKAKNAALRRSLGTPRLLGGSIRLASRFPILIMSIVERDWGKAGVFAMLAISDIASAMSQPAMVRKPDTARTADMALDAVQSIHAEIASLPHQPLDEPLRPAEQRSQMLGINKPALK